MVGFLGDSQLGEDKKFIDRKPAYTIFDLGF
jgi:hypothetical protein